MVSNASELLPDPDTPLITVSLPWGISQEMFFRLCVRAPRMMMASFKGKAPETSRPAAKLAPQRGSERKRPFFIIRRGGRCGIRNWNQESSPFSPGKEVSHQSTGHLRLGSKPRHLAVLFPSAELDPLESHPPRIAFTEKRAAGSPCRISVRPLRIALRLCQQFGQSSFALSRRRSCRFPLLSLMDSGIDRSCLISCSHYGPQC